MSFVTQRLILIWIGGVLTIPFTFFCLYKQWYFFPSIMVFYYGYTSIYPYSKEEKFIDNYRLFDSGYFKKIKIINDNEIDKNNPILFCILPHGILSIGALNFVSSHEVDKYNLIFLITDLLFNIPIVKEYIRLLGWESVKKENMISLMEKGKNIAFIPGGFEEATRYEYNKYKIYINNRKGFIKYVLKYGYNINPVFVFGEEKTYKTLFIEFFKKIGKILNPYGIPTILFYGKYFTPLPLNDFELNIVVGKQINFPTINNPSNEEIDKYHNIYKAEVIELFKKNVSKYGTNDSELILN